MIETQTECPTINAKLFSCILTLFYTRTTLDVKTTLATSKQHTACKLQILSQNIENTKRKSTTMPSEIPFLKPVTIPDSKHA